MNVLPLKEKNIIVNIEMCSTLSLRLDTREEIRSVYGKVDVELTARSSRGGASRRGDAGHRYDFCGNLLLLSAYSSIGV